MGIPIHLSALEAGFHMPAEWAPHERCWMAWPGPQALWGDGLPATQQGFANVANAVAAFEPVSMLTPPDWLDSASNLCGDNVDVVPWDLDDSWTRDIGPNFLVNDYGELAASVFHFNAWGGKYKEFRKDAALGHRLVESMGVRAFSSPIYMEGGGINVDGEGTVLTSEQCILNDNRNPGLTKAEAEHELCHALGAEKVVWVVGDPLDTETDGHVDGLACFIRPGVVLVSHDPDPTTELHKILQENVRALELATDARGRKLELVYLEETEQFYNPGDLFCVSYINFYIANDAVIIPSYGIPHDEKARITIQSCFPDRAVVQVDVNDIAPGGGGIHCITQQQPHV